MAFGDKYVLEVPLGESETGTVWAAKEATEAARRVVIAVLEDDAPLALKARLLEQGKALLGVVHPNLVRVLDVGTDDEGAPYLVMERLEGTSLAKRWEASPTLRADRTLEIGIGVVDGLTKLHDLGLSHGDVEPGNVLLVGVPGKEVPKLIGLGFNRTSSRLGAPGSRASQSTLQPFAFAAPEQARSEVTASSTADLYSAAAIVFAGLSGRPPHVGTDPASLAEAIAKEPAPLFTSVRKDLAPFAATLDRALQSDPKRRYADAGALGRALRTALAMGRIVGSKETPIGARLALAGAGAAANISSNGSLRPPSRLPPRPSEPPLSRAPSSTRTTTQGLGAVTPSASSTPSTPSTRTTVAGLGAPVSAPPTRSTVSGLGAVVPLAVAPLAVASPVASPVAPSAVARTTPQGLGPLMAPKAPPVPAKASEALASASDATKKPSQALSKPSPTPDDDVDGLPSTELELLASAPPPRPPAPGGLRLPAPPPMPREAKDPSEAKELSSADLELPSTELELPSTELELVSAELPLASEADVPAASAVETAATDAAVAEAKAAAAVEPAAVEPAAVEPATVEPATVEPAAVEPAAKAAAAVEPAAVELAVAAARFAPPAPAAAPPSPGSIVEADWGPEAEQALTTMPAPPRSPSDLASSIDDVPSPFSPFGGPAAISTGQGPPRWLLGALSATAVVLGGILVWMRLGQSPAPATPEALPPIVVEDVSAPATTLPEAAREAAAAQEALAIQAAAVAVREAAAREAAAREALAVQATQEAAAREALAAQAAAQEAIRQAAAREALAGREATARPSTGTSGTATSRPTTATTSSGTTSSATARVGSRGTTRTGARGSATTGTPSGTSMTAGRTTVVTDPGF